LWFSFMGGIGLRQQRQALELEQIGMTNFNDTNHFVSDESDFCYNVPQEDVVVNGTTVFTNTLPGITPVCTFDTVNDAQAWFNVMYSFSYPDSNNFGGFGPFLSGLSIITLAIYFITSSDSGSLVVDILASNGATEHHWIQRVFWAITEGAVACALLIAGDKQALEALQAASIVFGLPFNLFLFIMCKSIIDMCKVIEREQNLDRPHPNALLPKKGQVWSMPLFGGIFNIFEYLFSLGCVHTTRKEKGMHLPTKQHTIEFFVGLVVPFVSFYKIYTGMVIDPKQKQKTASMLTSAVYATCYVGWIVLSCFGGLVNHGFTALALSLFLINALVLVSLRMQFRTTLGIRGNAFGDFVAASLFYPQALAQMVIEQNGDSSELLSAIRVGKLED